MVSAKVKSLIKIIRQAQLSRSEFRELEELVHRLQYEQAAQMQDLPQIRVFPPKVPKTPAELSRAICLLGNRVSAELGQKSRGELTLLIGMYPNVEQANEWKRSLTQYLKTLQAQEQQVDDLDDPDALPPRRTRQPGRTFYLNR
jgi:hypothetical protein